MFDSQDGAEVQGQATFNFEIVQATRQMWASLLSQQAVAVRDGEYRLKVLCLLDGLQRQLTSKNSVKQVLLQRALDNYKAMPEPEVEFETIRPDDQLRLISDMAAASEMLPGILQRLVSFGKDARYSRQQLHSKMAALR